MKNVSPILTDFFGKLSKQIPKSQQCTAFQDTVNQSQYKLFNRNIVSQKQDHKYSASLSTGIYGSYMLQQIEKKEDNDTQKDERASSMVDNITEECKKLCDAATKFIMINDYNDVNLDYECKGNNTNWKQNAKILTKCFRKNI